ETGFEYVKLQLHKSATAHLLRLVPRRRTSLSPMSSRCARTVARSSAPVATQNAARAASSGSSSAKSLSSSSGGSQRTRATDWSAWLVVHSQRGAERARLVRQVSDAGQGSAFAVECQERVLVREVVSVQREVPLFLLDADPRVHDVVGWHLRVVREDARGVRS